MRIITGSKWRIQWLVGSVGSWPLSPSLLTGFLLFFFCLFVCLFFVFLESRNFFNILNWTHILQWNVFGVHSDGQSPLLNSFVRVKSLSMSKLVMFKGVQTKKSGWCRVRLFTALYFFVIFIRSLNRRIKDGIARELDASAKWCSRLFLLANHTPTYPRVLRVRFAWIFFCVHFARIFFRVR